MSLSTIVRKCARRCGIDIKRYRPENFPGERHFRSAPDIALIEIELSLASLYEGQSLAPDILAYLNDKGFSMISFERGFTNAENLHMLQCDAILKNDRIL